MFSQASLFGGSSVLLKPLQPEAAESVYNSAIQALGLVQQSSEDRIKSLLSISAELMLAKASNEMIAVGPTIDHDLIPAAATLDANDMIESPISSNRWCKRLFSIDSQFDVRSAPVALLTNFTHTRFLGIHFQHPQPPHPPTRYHNKLPNSFGQDLGASSSL